VADKPRVQQLLEEILESDRTPEEVCEGCPELLTEVRDRLGRLRALEARVDALFPTPASGPTAPEPPEGRSPQIPGYDVLAILGRGGMLPGPCRRRTWPGSCTAT
jgi:serine/threonine-protein kinase